MRGQMCDDAGAHFEQQKALLWSGRGSSHVNWFGLSESCQLDEKKEKQNKKKKILYTIIFLSEVEFVVIFPADAIATSF